jgi:hypothetical protein
VTAAGSMVLMIRLCMFIKMMLRERGGMMNELRKT